MRRKLSGHEDRGDVSVCGRCRDIHIRWDNLMLSLEREQFEAFAGMIGRARDAAPAREPERTAGRAVPREGLLQ